MGVISIDRLLSRFPDSSKVVDRKYVDYHFHFESGIFHTDSYITTDQSPLCVGVYSSEDSESEPSSKSNSITVEIIAHHFITRKEFNSISDCLSYIELLGELIGSKFFSAITDQYGKSEIFHGYLPETDERIVFHEGGDIEKTSVEECHAPVFSNTSFEGKQHNLRAIIKADNLIGSHIKYIYQNCMVVVQSGPNSDPSNSVIPLVKTTSPQELVSEELSTNEDNKSLIYADEEIRTSIVSQFV